MLKPSEEFDGVVSIGNRAHHHKVDRSLVPVAGSPSLSSAASFQDLVSRTAQGQGQRHQSVQISFDEEDGPHQFSGWPVITVILSDLLLNRRVYRALDFDLQPSHRERRLRNLIGSVDVVTR